MLLVIVVPLFSLSFSTEKNLIRLPKQINLDFTKNSKYIHACYSTYMWSRKFYCMHERECVVKFLFFWKWREPGRKPINFVYFEYIKFVDDLFFIHFLFHKWVNQQYIFIYLIVVAIHVIIKSVYWKLCNQFACNIQALIGKYFFLWFINSEIIFGMEITGDWAS